MVYGRAFMVGCGRDKKEFTMDREENGAPHSFLAPRPGVGYVVARGGAPVSTDRLKLRWRAEDSWLAS